MNYRWLTFINNFCGFYFIKTSKNFHFKESKFLKIYGILKFFIVILITTSLSFYSFRKKIYISQARKLKQYSNFSRIIFDVTNKYFHICAYLLLFLQFLRHKQILKILKQISNYELESASKQKLKKVCIVNSIYYFGILSTVIIIRNMRILKTENYYAFIVWFATFQSHLIGLAMLNFLCNFQQFIVIAMTKIESNLRNQIWEESTLEKIFNSFMKIENFLAAFETTFGLQLTLITVNSVFSIVTYVSLRTFKI